MKSSAWNVFDFSSNQKRAKSVESSQWLSPLPNSIPNSTMSFQARFRSLGTWHLLEKTLNNILEFLDLLESEIKHIGWKWCKFVLDKLFACSHPINNFLYRLVAARVRLRLSNRAGGNIVLILDWQVDDWYMRKGRSKLMIPSCLDFTTKRDHQRLNLVLVQFWLNLSMFSQVVT